jgi:hypothetical protein
MALVMSNWSLFCQLISFLPPTFISEDVFQEENVSLAGTDASMNLDGHHNHFFQALIRNPTIPSDY